MGRVKIADHWTNVAPRGEPPRFAVTGWHYADTRKPKAEAEHAPTGRGIMQGDLL